jgi:hypothetical protein
VDSFTENSVVKTLECLKKTDAPGFSGHQGTIFHTVALFLKHGTPVNWLQKLLPRRQALTPEQRAKDLVAAIDAGGLPLNAAVVNDIARQLGLEVSTRARLDETIARIRMALKRMET